MRWYTFIVQVIPFVFSTAGLTAQQSQVQRVPLQQVKINDPFWSPHLKTYTTITIPDVLDKFDGKYTPDREDLIQEKQALGHTRNAFRNFDLVAQGKKDVGGSDGPPWYDGLVYETISGAADLLVASPSAVLEKRLDGYIKRIAAAQNADPDGYLNTWTTLNKSTQRWGTNGGNDRWQHDVYNAGMLVEAGVHYYRATGKANLLAVAVKMANYMTRIMGAAPKQNIIPAHAGPEEAFLELYKLFKEQPQLKKQLGSQVNENDYYTLVKYWIETRGRFTDADGGRVRESYGSYNQDHIPVFQQKTIEGHAVRATLLGTAIAATALENSDPAYINTANNYWNNMIGQRLFITGGQGAIANDEKFGENYFLPESAYLETCAAVGAGFFSERMFELQAMGKYMDEFERVLYNNILSGISADGQHYNYENPLITAHNERWSWHSCPCCPPMFLKMMGALPAFIYGTAADAVYVNLYIGSSANVNVGQQTVQVSQQTTYPWTGNTDITLTPQRPAEFSVNIRVPGWATSKENPFDLYRSSVTDSVILKVNGIQQPFNIANGYATIKRKWRKGDRLTFEVPVKPRLIYPNPAIKALDGKVAIAAGPLVYALEDTGKLDQFNAGANPKLNMEYDGGVNIIRVNNRRAIPFYTIGNHGKSSHLVWLPSPNPINITVHADSVLHSITPYLHGSNIEDVNHEMYGGFYSQLIFGESFEEPYTGVNFKDWKRYTGFWTANGDVIAIRPGRNTTRLMGLKNIRIGVEPDESAKLVYDALTMDNGHVAVALKFDGRTGGNGGLLIGVQKAGIGADSFIGYEISLARDGKKIVLGYHNNNFRLLKEAAVQVNPLNWNRLFVNVSGKTIDISLNDQTVLSYDVADITTLKGKIGIRTWQSDIDFKDISVNKQAIPLVVPGNQQVSYNWDAVQTPGVQANFTIDTVNAFNGRQAQVIELLSGKGRAGVANRSLNRWGIALQEGQALEGSFWMKHNKLKGPITVALENQDGTVVYASQQIKPGQHNWQQYPFLLKSSATDKNARLVIYLDAKGKCWLDQVTLQHTAKDRFHGLPVRKDIGDLLQSQGLQFLRYAGTMVNAKEYRFRKMIGPKDGRPPYNGHWNKYSTNGFGIEEFLQYCEKTAIEAAFAINIEESPEDAAFMVEYLNGDTTTTGGKQRKLNGHAAAYGVKYIEIGNEEVIFEGDDATLYQHYIDRFLLLASAIHGKDPGIRLVNAAWWRPESPNMEKIFRALSGKAAYWDLHVDGDDADSGTKTYKRLRDMQTMFKTWDPQTDMKIAVFEENGGLHNQQRALGHATNLNAIRKMGDFVLTSTPANGLQPDGQNDNSWDQGQIFFSPSSVWGQPPYYAQQMAAAFHQPLLVKDSVTGSLDMTATRSEDGKTLVLHIINTSEKNKEAALTLKGFDNRKATVDVITLRGALEDENTAEEQKKIKYNRETIKLPEQPVYTFKPHSYTVLKFTR